MEVFDGNLEAVRDSLQSDLDTNFNTVSEPVATETEPTGETYEVEETGSNESESIEYY